MKKNKKPNAATILDALVCNQGGRVSAMRSLRDRGYKFRTTWFLKQCDKADNIGAVSGRLTTTKPNIIEISSNVVEEEVEPEIVPGGVIEASEKSRESLSPGVYVFTSAQSNTRVHEGFLRALEGYCATNDAELHVATFVYNKSGFQEIGIKDGSKKTSDTKEVWFDAPIVQYISDTSLQVADDLIWCGELNIIPTRINPLSSFGSYTKQSSGIIPHVKMAMQSVPTMKCDPAKFLYSTGTVTQRNYIQKVAGQVADFHHVFGALVVEVGADGTWFARQLNADDTGMFYDLNNKYLPDGTATIAERPLAINHGDIHWNKRDVDVMAAMFDDGGILDTLWPKNQFFHDTIDFQARNHHNIKDPHFLHQMRVEGTDNVAQEFDEAGAFLVQGGYRHWCQSYVVTSNHDQAIEQWLRNPAGQADTENAYVWHSWNATCYADRGMGKTPRPFMKGLQRGMHQAHQKVRTGDIRFLHEDDSLWLKGIQFGLHGHLGPNGARGAPRNLRTVGKANTGHTHSAGIVDGVYTAGVFGLMDMGYNKGLSSWSHSFILTYANGKRTIITMKEGKAWLD